MDGPPPVPLTRHRIVVAILINQLATPGLGSIMARRRLAGSGQLTLALAGFFLLLFWMFRVFYRMTVEAMGQPAGKSSLEWMWNLGLLLFGAAWVWSLVTSLSLLREFRNAPPPGPSAVPPRIPPLPPKC